ncbi:MAG TPA: hypothetical protein VFZ25_05275 [Chloroflexota bacterium]|nr:hypothetical protein [Chloroflexota bacterium]
MRRLRVSSVLSKKLSAVGLLVLIVSLLTSRNLTPSAPRDDSVTPVQYTIEPSPAAYALYPSDSTQLRNPKAVQKAIDFLTRLQPDGTYVLSAPNDQNIVPMDVAHAAIALAKVDRRPQAEAAMNWLYGLMILPGPGSYDAPLDADFAGSWYDQIQTDGRPADHATRGRGEAVGIALIATYTIYREDPAYIHTRVGDNRIIDLVRLSVAYLTQPSMQTTDGRFYHSPDYQVPFNEEGARMTLGLKLASEMLAAGGDQTIAKLAAERSALGLQALRKGEGISQGMAYDYYAMSIWGLATPAEASSEMSWLKSTGLVNQYGVKNWDWQLTTASTFPTWLRWWVQAQTITPAPTFDYAIAALSAGDVNTALRIEQEWVPRQRNDGGFDDAYLFGLRVGVSPPTSYAVARFLMLERLLTDVVGSTSNLHPM